MLYASSLRRAQQERLPRRILGGLLAADGHQLAAQPLEAALGRPVRLRCVGQVLAPQPEVLLQAIEVAAKTRQQPHHLLGARLDPELAMLGRDRLQVGVEAVGRHRDDLAVEAVGGETGLLVADDGLVVDVLGRDVHECEVVGALVGEHVLGRDVVDVPPYPGSERLARARALVVVRGLEQAPEVPSGNLASTGTSPPPRRTTASTRSPLRKACWSVKWAGGSTCARRSPRRSSPRPPRSFGARRISCSEATSRPTS